MLVLSRKVGQKLVIGDNISIVVNQVSGKRVTLGIEAPSDVQIMRGEVQEVRDGFGEAHEEVQLIPLRLVREEGIEESAVGAR